MIEGYEFLEAADMAVMCGGKSPVIRPLSVTENGTYNAPEGVDGYDPVYVNVKSGELSLDGIKKLNTLATVVMGAYTFEIKEPKLFYAGKVTADISKGYDAGVWECSWLPAVILNDTIAFVSPNYVNTEYRAWGKYTDNDGNAHSSYYHTYSDFAVTNATVRKSGDRLPTIVTDWSYDHTSGYDTEIEDQSQSTGTVYIPLSELSYPILTDLSYSEYFQFVKGYLENTVGVDPAITIL